MENIWSLNNIRRLFSLAKAAEESGDSLSKVFTRLASELDCSVGSVRNYYYSQAKLFKMIPSLATEMGIEQAITRARPFVTFDPEEAETILVNAHHKRTVIRVMDKLDRDGISYYNPYAHEITLPGTKTDLAGVLEKIDRLSGEEKEVLLRKILL